MRVLRPLVTRLTSVYIFDGVAGGFGRYSLAIMATRIKTQFKAAYQCRQCGSTCYQPVIERAPNGALLPNGQYRCTGCHTRFLNVQSWWAPRPAVDRQAQPG